MLGIVGLIWIIYHFICGILRLWTDDGCKIVEAEGSNVECECKHLTSFAVLMQYVKVRKEREKKKRKRKRKEKEKE